MKGPLNRIYGTDKSAAKVSRGRMRQGFAGTEVAGTEDGTVEPDPGGETWEADRDMAAAPAAWKFEECMTRLK